MKSSEPGWRRAALACASAGAALLGGCSIISPWPAWEIVKGAGAVASLALERADSQASNTVAYPHAPTPELCIAFNPQAEVVDIVPALQLSLRRHRVDSRVYDDLQQVPGCKVWLHYAAWIDWDTPPLTPSPRPYISAASLTLRTSEGQVLSSSHYVMSDGMRTDKWATTRDKLAPVVTALVTGSENVGFFKCLNVAQRAKEEFPHAPTDC
ncbi:cell division protein FtsI [Pseudorhodoferax sp.]|uniref:cell division protein FtsI n=1 Tax=Pseudorhodoferax sp. TaxID=1993553 RepID=UPI002DD6AB00|nr:cell division protein FtsI [Pseudorhodoferax sp.]